VNDNHGYAYPNNDSDIYDLDKSVIAIGQKGHS
jgi:hypothetical protein